jgi:asparagine synthase (glutamine-hydrolysing)
MCGIAGFIAKPGYGRSSRALEALQSITHRGPDDFGWQRLADGVIERGRAWTKPLREPNVLLLHRRLSILDTTEMGWQPMSSRDGKLHVAFNGEIYNFKELRDELTALGHTFVSRSDTEVLLAAYAQWGLGALRRFVGMFAFALLDLNRKVVLLARDFFGIKPLYYSIEDGLVCFGSEIKALFALGLTSRAANTERLLYFLRYGLTDFGAETMFSAVRQIPPAHYVKISLETCVAETPVCFWEPDSGPELEISFDEAADELKRLFIQSVELHLRSDVPVGAALSGGIDSSAIISAIRHLDRNAEIHAFSFISEDQQTNEESWIDLVGKATSAHVHKVRINSREFLNDLDAISRIHDEPSANTSMHAQYQVFREAHRAGVKVMLDGQGADEILAGYRLYIGARLASLLRGGEWSQALRLIGGMSHLQSFRWTQGLAFCADYLVPPELQGPVRLMVNKEAFPFWLNRSWFAERGADILVTNYTRAADVLKHSLTRSLSHGLPKLLRYEDRNSMASSVESRVPFLTPDLVNFVGRLPESYLISQNGTSKNVFRKAMRGLVPDSVLDRRDKIGFATPEIQWLSELDNWVRGSLNSEETRKLPFLNLPEMRKEWESIRDRKKPFHFSIWRWLNLILWVKQFQVTFEH